jgi:hypothetical protein
MATSLSANVRKWRRGSENHTDRERQKSTPWAVRSADPERRLLPAQPSSRQPRRGGSSRRNWDETNAAQLAVIRSSPDLSPVPARLGRRWPEWPEPRPGTGAGGPGRGISESRGDDSARRICDKDRECTIWLYELLSGGSRSALRAFEGSLLPTSTHASVEEDVLYSCFRGLPLTAA